MDNFAHTGNDGYNMMSGWGSGSGGDSLWGWLLMFMMMLLVVLGAILLIRFATNNQANKNSTDALDILKQRYARGEINKKQFDEMKQDIK